MNFLYLLAVSCLALVSTTSAAEFSAAENTSPELFAQVDVYMKVAEEATLRMATFAYNILIPAYEGQNYRRYTFPERVKRIYLDLQAIRYYKAHITAEKDVRAQEAQNAVARARAKLEEDNHTAQSTNGTRRAYLAASLEQRDNEIARYLNEAQKILDSADIYISAWNKLFNESTLFLDRLESGEQGWRVLLEEQRATCANIDAELEPIVSFHRSTMTLHDMPTEISSTTIFLSKTISPDVADSLFAINEANKAKLRGINAYLNDTILPDIYEIKRFIDNSETDTSSIVKVLEEVQNTAEILKRDVTYLLNTLLASASGVFASNL